VCVCVSAAVGTYVLSCSIATAVSSNYSIPALRHCITLTSKVVVCGVFYAVHVITDNQHVKEGFRQSLLSTTPTF
jgi:hypothetical protein